MEEKLYYYKMNESFIVTKHKLSDEELPEGAVKITKKQYDSYMEKKRKARAEEQISPEVTKRREIIELKQQLYRTDYLAIKFAEGVITEEEYAPTKAKRQEWRTRINELEEGLNEESSNSPEK